MICQLICECSWIKQLHARYDATSKGLLPLLVAKLERLILDMKGIIMSFERWGYQFDGAYTSPDSLQSRSGVYVIWCKYGDNWTVLDVGESADVRERVGNHERAGCWSRNCLGTIYYSATYTPNLQQAGRVQIEQRIRNLTNPPCGRC